MKTKNFHYAWIILIAVSVVRGVAGPAINGSAGVFMTPVAESLGVGIGQLSVYLSISSAATLVWLPIAGNLYQKYSVKTVAAAGILLQTLSFIFLGFMTSVWGFYILAVPLAMGATLLVNLLGPLLVNRWYTKNVGFIMGMMMMITSLLGAVFQPIFTTLIGSIGWRETYVSFGIFALAFMMVVCLLFLKSSPKDKGLRPYGEKEGALGENNFSDNRNKGISFKTALKSPAFFSLLLFMIVITGFASFQQHIATFGLGIGLNMATIGKALSISMIGSSIGAVLIGIFSDKLGIVPTSLGVLAVGAAAVILFLINSQAESLFIAATFLHGLATSSIGVVAPLLTKKFFGSLEYEKLFSTVMIGSPLASIVLMPAYGFIYDLFKNYDYVFIFLAAALLLAAIGLIAGLKNSKRLNASG